MSSLGPLWVIYMHRCILMPLVALFGISVGCVWASLGHLDAPGCALQVLCKPSLGLGGYLVILGCRCWVLCRSSFGISRVILNSQRAIFGFSVDILWASVNHLEATGGHLLALCGSYFGLG